LSAAAIASPIPVLPLVASTMVPLFQFPRRLLDDIGSTIPTEPPRMHEL
jgi:hypothetical protein